MIVEINVSMECC